MVDVPVCGEIKAKKTAVELPADEELVEFTEFMQAFGDLSRVKILFALLKGEFCTCDLSSITGLSVSAVSHQLRILRDKKLVKYRREGRNVFYSLNDEHVIKILEITMEHVREK